MRLLGFRFKTQRRRWSFMLREAELGSSLTKDGEETRNLQGNMGRPDKH